MDLTPAPGEDSLHGTGLGEPGTRHYPKSVPFGHPANAVLSFIQMWSVKKNHIFDEPWRLAQETWNKLFINCWNQLIENMPQPSQKEMLLPRCTTWSLPSFRTSWKSTKCFKLPKIIIYKKEKAYYIWQMYFNFKHAEPLAEKNKTRQKNKIP